MDGFKKVFLAGVGALSLSKDKAKKVVEELIAQGQIKEKEGRQLVDEMLKKADKSRKEIESTIKSQLDGTLAKVNLATQAQLKKMEKRIHDLEQHLAKKAKDAPAVKKTVKKTVKKKAAVKTAKKTVEKATKKTKK